MAIHGSELYSVSAGINTLVLPADNLLMVGFTSFGTEISFLLSPGTFAIPPQPVATVQPNEPVIRTHHQMKTTNLIVNASTAGTFVFYYGDKPLADSTPLESFTGVSQTAAFAASGATSQTITVSMPKSGSKITGISMFAAQTGFEYEISWNTGTGKNITFYSTPGQMARARDILPLNLENVANSFTVTVSTSSTSAANTINFIIYYQ